MAPKLISEVMMAEHKRLGKMLDELIAMIAKKSPDTFKKFIEFKWNLEKHFFVEEKAIFTAYSAKLEVAHKMVDLISEHKQMISIMRENERLLDNDKNPDFTEFRKIILSHIKIENDYFYTGLEENLNEDVKAEILSRTLEIIRA